MYYSTKLAECIAANKPQLRTFSFGEIVQLAEQAGIEVVSGDESQVTFCRKGHAALVAWGEEITEPTVVKEERRFGPLRYTASVSREVTTRGYDRLVFEPNKGLKLEWFTQWKEGKIIFTPYLTGYISTGGGGPSGRDVDREFLSTIGVTGVVELDTGDDPIIELPIPSWVYEGPNDCGPSGIYSTLYLRSEVEGLIRPYINELEVLTK